jgi:glutaredoxin 3
VEYFTSLEIMKKLELYYFDECPYCHIVLEAIDRLNLRSQVKFINTIRDPKAKKKLIDDTGRGTVPCLYIDDHPMHESRDIIRWLESYAREIG